MSNLHRTLGNTDSAYIYSNYYSVYNDSINTAANRQKMQTLQMEFDFKQLETTIHQQGKKIVKYYFLFILAGLLCSLILLLLYRVNKQKRYIAKELLRLRNELYTPVENNVSEEELLNMWKEKVEELQGTDFYQMLVNRIKSNRPMNEQMREELTKFIEMHFPEQYRLLFYTNYSDNTRMACCLALLDFRNKDIAILLSVVGSGISHQWRRKGVEIFGQQYSSKDFLTKLRCYHSSK